jgi:cytochrome o ubiquinol oxidase subunit 3
MDTDNHDEKCRAYGRMQANQAGGRRSFAQRISVVFFCTGRLARRHVTAGLVWLIFMVAQTSVRGPRDFVRRRLLCFSLFWHALDIIWVALLTGMPASAVMEMQR